MAHIHYILVSRLGIIGICNARYDPLAIKFFRAVFKVIGQLKPVERKLVAQGDIVHVGRPCFLKDAIRPYST